jgi:hypothetical protein
MERDQIAARNRRLALILTLFIFFMIGVTIFWMSVYNNLGA